MVLCYCGIDQVLRETAGNFTLLQERLSDTAIHKRLKACLPWVKALLERMRGAAAGPLIDGHLRFVVVDGSTVPGPGAKETWYRLHLAVDLVKLHLIHIEVTAAHQGEHLGYYPLQEGDVVVDRGYNQASRRIEQADRGVSLVVRYNPHSLNLYDAAGVKIDWYEALKTTTDTARCLPVRVQAEGQYLEGYVHACRLPPAQAAEARRRVQAQAKKKGRQVQQHTLALAEWGLIFTTLPPVVLPTATIAALYRVRWQVEIYQSYNLCNTQSNDGNVFSGYPLQAGQSNPESIGVLTDFRASTPVNSRQNAGAPRETLLRSATTYPGLSGYPIFWSLPVSGRCMPLAQALEFRRVGADQPKGMGATAPLPGMELAAA